jgi:hypothetical protein
MSNEWGHRLIAVLMGVLLASLPCGHALATDTPDVDGGTTGSEVLLSAVEEAVGTEVPPESTSHGAEARSASLAPTNYTYEQVRYSPECRSTGTSGGSSGCVEVRSCPGGTPSYGMFTRTVVVTDGREDPGIWAFAGWTCRTDTGVEAAGPALPQVTWQIVLREVQRVGLPSLEVQVQPAGRTLVNFDTNFYAEPEAFERQLTLLGQGVEVRAEPVEFAWTFGDGTTDATESPGAPYPELEVTHAYTDADVTVEPSVAVTYTAEFRVGDGEWQQIPETVTISGPPTSLQVVEATPVLSGEGR